MTLIELLIVITILTTLVAGVIPILSPDNDVRKLREASRGLQAHITSAQAGAAKSGRPHGVFFKKLSADTGDVGQDRGVCLEVFHIETPPAFAGFSEASRVVLRRVRGGSIPWVAGVRFVMADDSTSDGYIDDPPPPNLLRRGDVIEVDGARYRIVDPDRDGDGSSDVDPSNPQTNFRSGDYYTLESGPKSFFTCEPLPSPPPPLVNFVNDWSAMEHYRVIRQPSLSDEAPYQLPRGICVDLQCSGLPTSSPIPSCCHNPLKSLSDVDGTSPGLTDNDDGVAVMFAPDGSVSSYIWNPANIDADGGASQTAAPMDPTGQIYFLVGRRENVPTPQTTSADWEISGVSEEQGEEIRQQINWLNADSRWIAIGARSGRVITADNNVVNLNNPIYSPSNYNLGSNLQNLMAAVTTQIGDARRFAREMRQVGGN